MTNFYYPSGSIVHRLSAGVKLAALIIFGTLIFTVEDLAGLGFCGVFLVAFFCIAQIPLRVAYRQLKPALFLLLLIFIAQYFMVGFEIAVFVVVRFSILILAAGLVTVTTRVSEMVEAIEAGLRPLAKWVAIEKVSLAITLAIRFIPVLGEIVHEVRDAQKVRGMDRNIIAVLLPTIIRTLKMATEVAEALDARSFATLDRTRTDKQKL
ncbi:energy-coupling factor transporter transmembrane component T family protein [Sneathiella glossodoripedis]|uniref:energy-coupling factor transporter transmembrane component T family protein n=1 Tax=Sneathiella glossodoripedis TaxID=418853 RepID=UPI0004713F9C|nr:energy-coupling factor transporter transmembrane protein EcfT [Sneathiella glossodoripedis]